MREKSQISLLEFYGWGITGGLIIMVWYKSLLFRCLEGMTYSASKLFLWELVIGAVLLGGLVTFRYYKSKWASTASLLLAYGVYTILTYMGTIGIRIKATLICSISIGMIYGFLIFFRKIRNQRKKKKIIVGRVHRFLFVFQSSLAVGMAVIMASICLPGIFGTGILQSSVEATGSDQGQAETLSKNIDTVLLLQENRWKNLDTKEKLNVLQTVANIEAHYLGLPNELNVGASNFKDTNLGKYDDEIHTIYINLSHLENDSVYEVLNSCCHEAYHSYQHRLVDAYEDADASVKNLQIYRKAAVYKTEFEDYADGDEDFELYYQQKCEADAREYAESAVEDYYSRIQEYLEGA